MTTNNLHKPVILISANAHFDEYAAAIEQNGGIAVIGYLPPACGNYDGLMLAGGNDVDPARYGEGMNGSRKIDPARDAAEYALLDRFAAEGKPIFGICRGHQILNVYFGGTLVQDLPTAESHRESFHPVRAMPDSRLCGLYGEEFGANSFHHQGIETVAPGFRATAYCQNDGVCEAIEHETKPWFSVQFHPERMCTPRPGIADGNAIFRHFLSLCGK